MLARLTVKAIFTEVQDDAEGEDPLDRALQTDPQQRETNEAPKYDEACFQIL